MSSFTRIRFLFGVVGFIAAGQAMAYEFVNVCDRSKGFKDFLVFELAKPCGEITANDLEAIKRVDASFSELVKFEPRDVSNFPILEILNLNGNPFTTLPPRAFVQLTRLKTIVLIRTGLTELPDDFLEANENLENLIMYRNNFTHLSAVVLDRIKTMPSLKIIEMSENLEQSQKDELRERFPVGGPVSLEFL